MPLRFFLRTSKTLMRLSVFFWKVYGCKIFHETFPQANGKNHSRCQYFPLIFIWCERATVGDSMRARCNF